SLSCLRLEPDVPAHAADELVADVEPEPCAADATGHMRIDAVELLEDHALLVGRNPEPLVTDLEEHVLFVPLDADFDPAAVGRVLDRVLDQVHEDLPNLVAVRLYQRQIVGHSTFDVNTR